MKNPDVKEYRKSVSVRGNALIQKIIALEIVGILLPYANGEKTLDVNEMEQQVLAYLISEKISVMILTIE